MNLDNLNKNGLDCIEKGEFEEAINYFDKALEKEPKNVEIINNKGYALKEAGHYEEALQHFEIALSIDPSYKIAMFNIANIYDKLGGYDKAIEFYNEIIKDEPKHKEALFNKANTLAKAGKYEQAVSMYNKLIKNDPKHKEALNNKGNTLMKLKKYDEAIIQYDQAIAIEPKYIEAIYNKGLALAHKNKYEEALKYYDEAINLEPDNEKLWEGRRNALDKLERYEDIVKHTNDILNKHPENQTALYNKIITLNKLGKHDEAIQNIDKLLEINPKFYLARVIRWERLIDMNDARMWEREGDELYQIEKYYDAVQCYQQAQLISNADALTLKKAKALKESGKKESALDIYKHILEKQPDNIEALNNSAYILISRNDTEEAEKYLDKVLTINKTNQDALRNKGWSAFEEGEYEKAVNYYNKALKQKNNDTETLYRKAQLYEMMNNDDETFIEDEEINLDKYETFFNVAETLYDKVINGEGNCKIEALNGKAELLLDEGNYKEALEQYNKALEIKPDDINTLADKGNLHRELKMYREAFQCFDKILDKKPQNTDTLKYKGDVYYEAGLALKNAKNMEKQQNIYFNEAIRYYDAILKINPKSQVLYDKENTLKNLNEPEALLELYQKIQKVDENKDIKNDKKDAEKDVKKAEKKCNKAFSLYKKGKLEKALALYLNVKTNYSQKYLGLGEMYKITNKYDEAFRHYEKAGDILYHSQKYQDCIKAFDKALDLDKDDIDNNINTKSFLSLIIKKGDVYYEKEDYQKSVETFSKAIELNEKYNALTEKELSEVFSRKGRSLDKFGKYDEALDAFNEAIHYNPENIQAYYNKLSTYYDKQSIKKSSGINSFADIVKFLTDNSHRNTLQIQQTDIVENAIERLIREKAEV